MRHCSLSQNVMVRFLSGAKIFLSIFFLGSSVFAAGGENYVANQPVTEKKDISVFVTKLSERLGGVVKEILSLSTSDQPILASASDSQAEPSKTLIDVRQHLYASEILALADLGVVDANREKFYPDNYLRRYELIMMLVKYRLAKSNTQLSPVVFPLRGWFFDVAQNTSYAPYVAYAEQQGWIDQMVSEKEGKKLFSPNKFLTKAEVCNLLEKDTSHEFCTNDVIKRGEFVALLSRGFAAFEAEDIVSDDALSLKTSQKNTQPLISQFKTLFSLATSQ